MWTSEVSNIMAEQSGLKRSARAEILAYLADRKNEGATDQELELALGRPGNTIRPMRVKLLRDGLIINPEGRWRFTKSNRPALVWVLAEFARDAS